VARGSAFRLADLPEHMRAQVAAQLGPQGEKRPARAMTKVERAYGAHLEGLRLTSEIKDYRYEPLRLVLATKTTYCPDYLTVLPSGLVHFVEVKGRKSNGKAYWKEDARLKIKLAAETFDGVFTFEAVWPDGNGGWCHEAFSGRLK
jgi:hypothetical protein